MLTDAFTLVDRATVARHLADVDVVEVVREALKHHARGQTVLPTEGYLPWVNEQGAQARSLAMLGAIQTGSQSLYGAKVINSAISNPARGMERAGGFVMLFDPETARPRILAEGGLISATRTAAYTVASLGQLGPASPRRVSILGCGTLAAAHLRLLNSHVGSIEVAHVYDHDPARAAELARLAAEHVERIQIVTETDPLQCVRASNVLITTTTSTQPYIDSTWFEQPTFVAHVSLDDVDASVFAAAELVVVDDLALVRENPRRVLGRLLQDASPPGLSDVLRTDPAVLGELLLEEVVPMRPDRSHIVSNPFGMAILDVALLGAVAPRIEAVGDGYTVDLVAGLH